MTAPHPQERWIVKQVNSVDSITLFRPTMKGAPEEKTITLSGIRAPRLAKPKLKDFDETKDEPWAWEAREFLRKKLVGNEVFIEKKSKENTKKDYFNVRIGKDLTNAENIVSSLVSEGLTDIIPGSSHSDLSSLYEAAKIAKKGKHGGAANPQEHVRDVKWSVPNPLSLVEKYNKQPISAIIEQVRDGSTVRALLLPEPDEYITVTLLITGIRCPTLPRSDAQGLGQAQSDPEEEEELAKEAKFFVEKRLLQRDVKIILEGINNNFFVGTILHPKGNIAETLLGDGFAVCIDWSLTKLHTSGMVEKYRKAEKSAREKKLKRWKLYQPKTPALTGKEKEFTATVVEVVGGDALMVKNGNEPPRKIFLSSVRPPRIEEVKPADGSAPVKQKLNRPLYDIPWMFEAREFLRKKLIAKKVGVLVDYTQPATDNFPEKTCCTVSIGGNNIAEALINKGLGKVVRYKLDDYHRSSQYDNLYNAELRAMKAQNGLFSKKDIPQHRVNDLSGDSTRARQFLSSLQRCAQVEAVVEFVTSGSRLRLFIPKETCLITFLLAGINCPRGARPATGTLAAVPGEPYGEEALQFTKDRCLQRDVKIQVDNIDKVRGNFIGWLWIDDENLSVALVRAGLASVHFSADKTEHGQKLKAAEDIAKQNREKLWKDFVEEEVKEDKADEEVVTERKVDQQKVVVVEATKELKFYVQNIDQGPNLEKLMNQIRQEFQTNPPLPGVYTPRKGDICAAKYSDDQWYRARVERVAGADVHIFYIDYGNKEVLSAVRCASLPSNFTTDKPYANEFSLALVKLANDTDYQEDAVNTFRSDIIDRTCLLNIEYRVEKTPYATLVDATSKVDLGKELVKDGFLLLDPRKDKRLQKLMSEYRAAQDEAKTAHRGVWEYGDITEDDAKEFGR